MKRTVLALLVIILGFQFPAHAQLSRTALATSIDSLQQLVNTHPKEDTTKVNVLNALARFCFYDFQYKRGIMNAKEARLLAQKINYRKGEGLYLRALAVLNAPTALSFYFDIQTRWFYERIGEKETLNLLKDPRRFTIDIDWKKFVTELFIALNYAQKQQDKEITAMLLQLISGMYSELHKQEDCLVYTDQAIQVFYEINQPIPAFYMLASKMATLEKLKRPKEAKIVEARLIKIITQTQDVRDKALLCERFGSKYVSQNQYALGLEYLFKANTLLEQLGETQLRVEILAGIGWTFNALTMYKKAVVYYTKAIPLLDNIKNYPLTAFNILGYLGYINIKLKQFNKASHYIKQVNELASKWGRNNDYFNHETQGEILMYQGHPQEAIAHFRLSNEAYKARNNTQLDHPFINLYIGQCYLALGNFKESIAYGEKAYKRSPTYNMQELLIKSCLLLAEAYEKSGQPMKAYEYLKQYRAVIKTNEEQDLVGRSTMAEIEGIVQKSEQEKAALEREKLVKEAENQNQRWWLITAVGILASTIILLGVLYRNNKNKQKANALLQKQKEEIEYQRTKAENALTDLKATQTQLIQKEKLASLGELTAGIAHEIQNPLNFVNNFSEVSTELIDEFREGPFQKLPESEKDYAGEILGDLTSNLKKINHHGGRASSIVKGMLEHSRTESGEKRPIDLNALADEYLKIAYHGLRAKDKGFNCELVTDFDPELKPIEVAPQEIGRVLLNLYNNAFYAVQQKQAEAPDDYKPTVTVSTRLIPHSPERAQSLANPNGVGINANGTGRLVEIRVRDNGTGIPDSVKAKIFQPFFTTKPTGEGTGLGLSLSYDIITKGHGGSLTVESTEGEGTEFRITLPLV